MPYDLLILKDRNAPRLTALCRGEWHAGLGLRGAGYRSRYRLISIR
jgi:hypothetical protein